jgi:hypothetical protein
MYERGRMIEEDWGGKVVTEEELSRLRHRHHPDPATPLPDANASH